MINTSLNNAAMKLGSLLSVSSTTTLGYLPAGWHLQAGSASQVGIDAVSVWPQYSGQGVSIGVFDDGVYGLGSTAAGYGKHGTAVAGIIAGSSSSGATGIAYNASVSDIPVIGYSMSQITAKMGMQSAFDIVNHSWGWSTPFQVDEASATYSNFIDTLADAAEHGRGGLGTLINVAAGNFRASGFDTNASNFTNDRHVITVTAVTSDGGLTDYASRGASVLVAAPSGGGSAGGILTSDLPGAAGYAAGSLTSTFSGTSAATPQVSGVEALMLEANPHLGWRDVKTILAMSSETLPIAGAVVNGAKDWNGGGMLFSNDVGFGVLDARAAVRLAETWLETSTSANEATATGTMTNFTRVLDNKTTEFKIDMQSGVDVESITLSLDQYHGRISDLTIELVSPSGTVSSLLSGFNGGKTVNDWTFTSNAFLGEDSGGTWTVRITDSLAGQQGVVNSAKLSVFGAAANDDDTFVFTDSFSTMGTGTFALNDTAGFDSINAAAVSSDSVIDLQQGHQSSIDGRAVVIGAGTKIESAFGGDGNDKIIGNDGANLLWGGRGNDIVSGGAGDDTIISGEGHNWVDGGAGSDTLRLAGGKADWQLSVGSDRVLANAVNGLDTNEAINVERFMFDDGMLAFDFDGTAGQGFRIYQAAFDRSPDVQGLAYWIRQLDKGMALDEVADRFMDSAEFKSTYGASLSTDQFVFELYANVHHRAPDQEGFDFWTSKLADGTFDRADVLVRFSDSNENIGNVSEQIKYGIEISNDYLSY
jgi:subtilisin-like proprotein convertase family protein